MSASSSSTSSTSSAVSPYPMLSTKEMIFLRALMPLLESDIHIIAPDGREYKHFYYNKETKSRGAVMSSRGSSLINRFMLQAAIKTEPHAHTVVDTSQRQIFTQSPFLCEMSQKLESPKTKEAIAAGELSLPFQFKYFKIVQITSTDEFIVKVGEVFAKIHSSAMKTDEGEETPESKSSKRQRTGKAEKLQESGSQEQESSGKAEKSPESSAPAPSDEQQ